MSLVRARNLLVGGCLWVAASGVASAHTNYADHHADGHMWDGTWGWGMGWMWWVPLLLLLAVAGSVLVYWLARRDGGSDAMEELRLRYARGDISEEEFEERRRKLD